MRHGAARHHAYEDDIARCGVLALLLEVSAYPKPGNVSRMHDFPDTKYEHFMASAVALFPVFRYAALIGVTGKTGGNIGRLVREGVEESMRWQSGGNTHFGSILLFIPLAMAAGKSHEQLHDGSYTAMMMEMREHAIEIMRESTVEDAVQLYNAFQKANVRVQHVDDLDVRDPDAVNEILRRGLTLHDILSISASYDTVSAELVGGFPRSFKYAELILEMSSTCTDTRMQCNLTEIARHNARRRHISGKHIISDVISYAYIHLLASEEDTFVRMKFGAEKSRYVRERAAELLKKLNGFFDYENVYDNYNDYDNYYNEIEKYDDELITHGINPGTSADIIAAAIFIALLCGLKI